MQVKSKKLMVLLLVVLYLYIA